MSGEVKTNEILQKSGVDIRYLKLFKRLQYDTVIPMFDLKI